MNPAGFHTITLGCKLNQFDAAGLEGELVRRGLEAQDDPSLASVVVVNTCTVTHRADADARKLIRSIRRGNPHCKLLVTGCYAEGDPETLRAMDGVDRVFGNRDKPHFAGILDELGIGVSSERLPGTARATGGDRGCDAVTALPQALHFGERSRAFLKIQEGCRLACSYCIIPRVRGDSRSVAPDEVLRVARALVDKGYHEIVLTGVNTGDFGRDLAPRTDLASLLRRLLERTRPARLRLNSLEPLTVTGEIVALMRDEPRLAPHLQVPLQSGSDTILGRMRRNYRGERYLETLSRLREAVPDVGLGADVIVGFPGETDALFEESYRFIAASPLSYLHVFSWSPRSGTPASQMDERIPSRVIRERSARLRTLGEELSLRFRKRFLGRALDAIAIAPRRSDGAPRALTGNFIEVALATTDVAPGKPIRVVVDRVEPAGTWGTPCGVPEWARTALPRLGTGPAGPETVR